jgi:DNA (cytosine-5)-methyltransferase 1
MKLIKAGSSLKRMWNELPSRIWCRYSNYDALHNNIYRKLRLAEAIPTIVHPTRAMLLHPRASRIISVREAARIQSFPDPSRFSGILHEQYQQVANAAPPRLVQCIAEGVLALAEGEAC